MKGKPLKPTLADVKLEQLKKKYPELAEELDSLRPKIPRSMTNDMFIPDIHGKE